MRMVRMGMITVCVCVAVAVGMRVVVAVMGMPECSQTNDIDQKPEDADDEELIESV